MTTIPAQLVARPTPVTSARARGARRPTALLLGAVAFLVVGTASSQEPPPFRVTIKDDKVEIRDSDALVPVEPGRKLQWGVQGLSPSVRSENGQMMHLSHYPTFSIDGQLHMQGQGGRPEVLNRSLPRGKGRQDREAYQSIYVFGDLRVTATFTLVPTRPAVRGARRRLDAVLTHYLIENKGAQPHRFGLRVYMDAYLIDNDGCQFAAPTMPGRVLNGVTLKDKQLPAYVQVLQRPNLQAPMFVAHLTLNLGSKIEKPDRVVLTGHGQGFNGWDMPAVMSGDTALGVFWEPKVIPPGGKRAIGYAYGQGLASSLEGEGLVAVALGGSFEPGKRFTVAAHVTDPTPGQTLRLELPAGMALLEGEETQPVVVPSPGEAQGLVLWKGRVLRPGDFTVRIHSSTGVTQSKVIAVARGAG